MRMHQKIIISFVAFLVSPLLFWLGGYDFNTRGEPAVFCFLLGLAFGGIMLSVITLVDLERGGR